MKKDRAKLMGLAFCIWLFLLASVLILPTAPAQAFRFVVMADSRGAIDRSTDPPAEIPISVDCLTFIKSQILKLNPKPDFVFFLGDMVRVARDSQGKRFLPDWINLMKPITTNPKGFDEIKLYVSIGNHELYNSNGCFDESLQQEFQNYFADMPDNGASGYKKLTYSFEHGKQESSFFIVLDTYGFNSDRNNWDNGLDAVQLAWLKDQAFSKTAKKAKYRFALAHGPAFSTEGWPVDDSMKKMWQTLTDANFDIYFCGHEHLYSRWRPRGEVIQTITGAAGAWPGDPLISKVDKSKAHIYYGYNYVVVDVEKDHINQKAYGVIRNGGEFSTIKIDEFIIRKSNKGNSSP